MKKITLKFIKFYQYLKPVRVQFTRMIFGSDRSCRFYPTCSDYAAQAVDKYGVKGLGLAFWRVLRCNPLGGKGLDPVK
jgi:uncharacterized protein